jgi:hypothetical protein
MVPFIALKQKWTERQARKQAKAEQERASPSTRNGENELDEGISDPEKPKAHHLEDAAAAVVGLGLDASNDVKIAVPIPCKSHTTESENSPSTRIPLDFSRNMINKKGGVDLRFVGNPIGIGSYKSFESPELSVEDSSTRTPSPNVSPTSTKFSWSTEATLNEEKDEDEPFPPIYQEPPSFGSYTRPKQRDWAKGKRKGRANEDEPEEVGALKDYLTHVDTASPVLHPWKSRTRAVSTVIIRTLTR